MRAVGQACLYSAFMRCLWRVRQCRLEICKRGGRVAATISMSRTPRTVGGIVLERSLVDEDHVRKGGCGEEFGKGPENSTP